MSGRPLDALVVGCGAVGSGYDAGRAGKVPPLSHAGAYSAGTRTRLAGGVDPDPAARARFEDAWGAPAFERVEDAMNQLLPRLVSVCTPPAGRLELVETVLAGAPAAIWVEKPLAASSADAQAIALAAERTGVPVQVNFLRRFDPLHQRAAELLAEPGRTPLHADFRFSGTFANYGSHAIDLARWFLGEIERVHVAGDAGRAQVALLETADGATATLMRVGTDMDTFDCEIYTPRGRLELRALGEELGMAPAAASPLFDATERAGVAALESSGGIAGAMEHALTALVAHIEEGAPLRSGAADGVAAIAVLEAIEEATP